MDLVSWLQVLLVCALGAMSPGPSLAVVLRNTVRGGKRQGVLTGIGHGLGILLYAGLVVTGLAVALAAVPQLELWVSYVGIALLLWLGFTFLGVRFSKNKDQQAHKEITGHNGFITGFLIAFLNPKIAAFFLAVFSPFLHADASNLEKVTLAMTAGAVDTVWYVLVALILSGTAITKFLDRNSVNIERAIGALLLFLAGGLVYRLVI
ncbi:MAG: LysE family translocator [Rhodospirillales bacterium]|jgi:threonine/homoserine/homoserine lactone efflux protein|nr:LysE family translocator [Rhodospirillales bacterium]